MKIVFVVPEAESYAVMLFSRLLKDLGHHVYLIFDPRLFNTDEIRQPFLSRLFDIRQHNLKLIHSIQPDFVGFSVYTQDYRWAVDFACMIKQWVNTKVVFGGIHCVLCYDEVIKESCIDLVCDSEGEKFIYQLVGAPVPNWAESLVKLDCLPLPDRDIFYEQKPIFKHGYTITTSRGCPYHCTFCASAALTKKYHYQYFRQRSVEHVMKELIWAKNRYKPSNIYFTDDHLTLNSKWLSHLALDYKKYINLPFYCTAHPGTIQDNDILKLKFAGCQMIGFGLQSANEKVRIDILDRYGNNQKIKEVTRLCHKLKLPFSFDHIFDIPGEPFECQEEALQFYNDTRPSVINTFTMTYLPQIALNWRLTDKERTEVNQGLIRTGMFQRGNHKFASIFSLLPLLPKPLIQWIINRKLYFRFSVSFWFRLLFKNLARIKIKRYSDIFFPILLILTNIQYCLKIKLDKKRM